MKVRLQKFLADAGVASRRAAELLISEGRVRVNGQPVRLLGTQIDPEQDVVLFDNKPVRPRRHLYVALNKPKGVVCSRQDPQGRRTVMDLIPREWSSLYPVGRLDFDTEGLILLTNDGDFCLRVSHPRYGVRKRYLAVVEGRVLSSHLKRLTEGIHHEGELLRADRARLEEANNTRSRIELELSEGRNREVRRLFEAQGLRVLSLRRLQIGAVRLGDLPSGRWRVLQPAEVKGFSAPKRRLTPGPDMPPSGRRNRGAGHRSRPAGRSAVRRTLPESPRD